MPTKPTAAQRAAAHVRRAEFDGPSFDDWDRIPAHLGSSNEWRKLAGRRPRADAFPVARVNCQPPWRRHRRPDWHPLFTADETEPTSRERREAEARGETQAPTELPRPRAATQEFAMPNTVTVSITLAVAPDREDVTALVLNGRHLPLHAVTGSLQLTSVHAFRDKSGDTAVVLGTDRGVIMPDELAADDQLPRSVRNAVLHDARRLIDQAIGDDFDFDFSDDDAPEPLKTQPKYKEFSFEDDDSYGDEAS